MFTLRNYVCLVFLQNLGIPNFVLPRNLNSNMTAEEYLKQN